MLNDKDLPKYISRSKRSYIYGEYPEEDKETGMFDPFFKRKRTWLVLAAFLVLFLTYFFFTPDVSGIEGLDQKKVSVGVAIFLCIAFLWLTEAMPLAATSILVPILGAIFGVFSVKVGLANFSNPLIYIFFGGFALASALAYQGIDRLIANRILLASKGNMLISSIALFLTTAFLSMWMSNTATTAMMIPLVLGIVNSINSDNESDKNRTTIFFLLGVAYSASIGGMGSIVGSPPNGIAARQLGISFSEWLSFGIPAVILLLPIMMAVLYIYLKPSLKDKSDFDRLEFKWTTPRKMTVIIFILTALCWIFSKKISALLGVKSSFDSIVALSSVFLLLYTRVLRWRDVERGVDWGVLLLFGGGIALSAVLKETGTSLYFAHHFKSLVAGWPIIIVVAAVILFVIFLTELSSNTATAALFIPIFYTVSTEMDIHPTILVLSIGLAASCAFMLPVATPPNAIVFGTGKIPQKTMIRVGFILNIIFIAALTLLSTIIF